MKKFTALISTAIALSFAGYVSAAPIVTPAQPGGPTQMALTTNSNGGFAGILGISGSLHEGPSSISFVLLPEHNSAFRWYYGAPVGSAAWFAQKSTVGAPGQGSSGTIAPVNSGNNNSGNGGSAPGTGGGDAPVTGGNDDSGNGDDSVQTTPVNGLPGTGLDDQINQIPLEQEVNAVPVPGTLAIFSLGLLALGFALRRRRI